VDVTADDADDDVALLFSAVAFDGAVVFAVAASLPAEVAFAVA